MPRKREVSEKAQRVAKILRENPGIRMKDGIELYEKTYKEKMPKGTYSSITCNLRRVEELTGVLVKEPGDYSLNSILKLKGMLEEEEGGVEAFKAKLECVKTVVQRVGSYDDLLGMMEMLDRLK